ncbi:hypothetical protein T484DRAFT_1820508, partial [Baffinella frigidus]
RALCAALAVISGQTEPLPARSMLTSLDGFKTFVIKVESGLTETCAYNLLNPENMRVESGRRVESGLTETRDVFGWLRKCLPQTS